MKAFLIFTVVAFAFVSAEVPPIPYSNAAAAASGAASSEPAAGDRIHTVGDQYVDHYGADGFNVQSGYEGYLIPAAEQGDLPFANDHELKSHHGFLLKFLKNLVALGWKAVPKVALGAVVLVALFLVGSCVNTLVCTYTPLCHGSYAGFGLTKDSMRAYLTPDRISTTANFVMDAITKYRNMYETLSNEIEAEKKEGK